MTRRTVHLITGATGFIGAALTLELLREPHRHLYVVVRSTSPSAAHARFHARLARAAAAYGEEPMWAAARDRCHVLLGDITQPLCGLADDHGLNGVDYLWHVAATLHNEEQRAEHIQRTNVEGTRHAADVARRHGAQLNYFSTAFVTGRRSGEHPEDFAPDTSAAPSGYDASKIHADKLVAEYGVPWRILRPSFVVGHSRSFQATAFVGFYGMARKIRRFRQQGVRTFGNQLLEHTLSLPGDPSGELNLVPVDIVARATAEIGINGPTSTIYHLTNATAPTVGTVLDAVFPWAGLRPPRLVQVDDDHPTELDSALRAALGVYGLYFQDIRFARINTDRVVGARSMAAPMDAAVLTKFLDAYLHPLDPTQPSTDLPRAAPDETRVQHR